MISPKSADAISAADIWYDTRMPSYVLVGKNDVRIRL
jgi:hypothetical protein